MKTFVTTAFVDRYQDSITIDRTVLSKSADHKFAAVTCMYKKPKERVAKDRHVDFEMQFVTKDGQTSEPIIIRAAVLMHCYEWSDAVFIGNNLCDSMKGLIYREGLQMTIHHPIQMDGRRAGRGVLKLKIRAWLQICY